MKSLTHSLRQPGRAALILLMLISLAHALIYVVGVPLWQAPDEPMLYEYAALTAELGRVPTAQDRSPALEERLMASIQRHDFWRYSELPAPSPLPSTLDELRSAANMPRQVGGDPPVYFVMAALLLRPAAGWSVEAQVYLLRVINALLLPAVVLCVYQIARQVGAPEPAPVAAAALVALQPMYTYIGMALSNDGPANAAAALLTLLLVCSIARGLRARDLALALALALLALQIKRTTVPLALLAAALAAIWALRVLVVGVRRPGSGGRSLAVEPGQASAASDRPPDTGKRAQRAAWGGWPGSGARGPANERSERPATGKGAQRATRPLIVGVIALALLLVAGGAWASGQVAWGQAARWYDARTLYPAPRAAIDGGYALSLEQGDEVTQVLPEVAAVYLHNGVVRMGARVWSDGPAVVRLVLDTGVRRQETSFALSGVADASASGPVSSLASTVRLGIVAEQGHLYVSRVWMRGVGLPGELITNGDAARPALRYDSPLVTLGRYLRVGDLLWVAESGRVRWGLAAGEWFRWLFDSFWGHFGWMRIAVVRGSLWEPAIGAALAAGLLGAPVALARLGRGRRWPLAALLALGALSLGLLLVNALIDPYPVQQGRYLFPMLPALAVVVACGQAAIVPARLRPTWLLAWLAFWLALAAAAMTHLATIYV